MRRFRHWHRRHGSSAPATPGFTAVGPEWLVRNKGAETAPAIPAPESTLGPHPCVALYSAQVPPEWSSRNLAVHVSTDGDYSLKFVSHSRGSVQSEPAEAPACR